MVSKIKFILKKPYYLFIIPLLRLPFFSFIRGTSKYNYPITFEKWFTHKVLGIGENSDTYWPVHPSSKVFDPRNIYAGVDTVPGFNKACYIQGMGGIYIGDYTVIASNVGIISANHDLYDNRKHIRKRVIIGKYCWLGFGAVVLPGVHLGDYTVVGANSVVTKSFPEGYCVLGGNPAKLIKKINKEDVNYYTHTERYYGYLNENKFKNYINKKSNLKRLFPEFINE